MFEVVQLYDWCTPVYTNRTGSQTRACIKNVEFMWLIFKVFPNIWITLENTLFHIYMECIPHISYNRTESLLIWILRPFHKRKKLVDYKRIADVGWKHMLCKQCKGQTLVELRKGWESLSLPSFLVLSRQSSFVPETVALTWYLNSRPAISHSAQLVYMDSI